MSKVAIVTDSNSGITQPQAKELGIRVMPMPFYINEEMLLEDIDLTQEQFYERLTEGADIHTSTPVLTNFTDLWDELLEEYDEIIHIPMSSGLSGSCQTARMLAEDYEGKVFVVNNQRISVTQRQSVLDAKELAEAGLNGEQIFEVLERVKMESSIYITVDTLKFLKKGGRITPAAAALGTLLRIKPVLQIQGEKLDSFSKARTMKQARTTMLAAVEKDLKERFADPEAENTWLFVAHSQNDEMAAEFAKEIEEHYPKAKPVYGAPLSLSIACHIGPGSLAVAMSKKIDAESERKRYGL
mgnify:CR=1 FL=1